MAHFAEIDVNNIVVRIITVSNSELLDESGVEQENLGAAFCNSLFGGNWKQTSYNESLRKNFAGEGCTYDPQRDAFISPKPFASWVLDETTCRWEAPVAMPDADKSYQWDEASTSWIEVT